MNENYDQEYATSEFPLAVALVTMNIKLLGLRRRKEDPQRVEFLFGKDDVIEKLVSGYWDGQLLVEPKKFWNQSRELKSRIKDQD